MFTPCASIFVYTNPSVRTGCDTRSIFKLSLTGLNSELSFSSTGCQTKAKELSLLYYLPIAGGRIIGFIPFPRVLALCEMHLVSSWIWTRVTVFISDDHNHYTCGVWRFLGSRWLRARRCCRKLSDSIFLVILFYPTLTGWRNALPKEGP